MQSQLHYLPRARLFCDPGRLFLHRLIARRLQSFTLSGMQLGQLTGSAPGNGGR